MLKFYALTQRFGPILRRVEEKTPAFYPEIYNLTFFFVDFVSNGHLIQSH